MQTVVGTLSWKTAVKNLYVVGLLALTVLIFTMISPTFIGVRNVSNILRQAVPGMLIGGAVTLIMVSEHIDLSVGGVVGITSVIFALLTKTGIPLFFSGIVGILLGVFIGFVNGLLVMRLRIVHVIATLVTMTFSIGLGKLLSPEGIGLIKGLPLEISTFGRSRFFLMLPPAFYVTLLVIAALVVVQKKTALGKYTAAIGGNRTAAELSGINVMWTVWILYMISGACAALAGIARTSYLSLGDPVTGSLMAMDAIIAVLLGGTRFKGGEGSVLRTVVAVLILTSLSAGMQVVGMPPYSSSLIKGFVLIVALVIDAVMKERIID